MSRIVSCFLLIIVLWSCKNDDDGPESVPPRLLSEVEPENNTEIRTYLQTHFYNYEEFNSPPTDFDFKVRFDTISGENANKIPLISQIENPQKIKVFSSTFGRTDGEEIEHTLYYLVIREGIGESPTIGDNAVLRYQGSLLDGTLFDASDVPIRQYLSSFVRGFSNGVIKLKTGSEPMENGDGSVNFQDYGIGVVFIPSGLAYFSSPPSGSAIPSYSPILFQIDLFSFEKDTDFDQDGIPSILEDLNGNGNLNDDNTDEDSENVFVPNHRDADDDNDGIPTIDEISDDNGNIITPYPDTDADGIPDYLDSDS